MGLLYSTHCTDYHPDPHMIDNMEPSALVFVIPHVQPIQKQTKGQQRK